MIQCICVLGRVSLLYVCGGVFRDLLSWRLVSTQCSVLTSPHAVRPTPTTCPSQSWECVHRTTPTPAPDTHPAGLCFGKSGFLRFHMK